MNTRTVVITFVSATLAFAVAGCGSANRAASPAVTPTGATTGATGMPVASITPPATAAVPSGTQGVPTTGAATPGDATQAPAGSASGPASPTTAVRLADFEIDPPELTVSGGAISAAVTNAGPTPHNLSIRDASGRILVRTPDLRPGASASASGELAPGSYITFCSLPGHESLGMRGTLVVR